MIKSKWFEKGRELLEFINRNNIPASRIVSINQVSAPFFMPPEWVLFWEEKVRQ